jgi:hypothetical protein
MSEARSTNLHKEQEGKNQSLRGSKDRPSDTFISEKSSVISSQS